MESVRFGLSVRAMRRRRAWSQRMLGERARCSQSTVSRVEQGDAERHTIETLERIVAALGARMTVRILWHGEALDRLLDSAHAALVESVVALLAGHGWLVSTEVTFNIYGERGLIDVLAFHVPTGTLAVVEVKTVVPDLQAMLSGIDRKARLGRKTAAGQGWTSRSTARLLVLPEDRTARRRVSQHAATLAQALPARNVAVRRWLARPHGPLAGILFVASARRG
jgi:transcriptional regulator with XRE-family HTH domain